MSDSGSTSSSDTKNITPRDLVPVYLSNIKMLLAVSESITTDDIDIENPICKGLMRWSNFIRKQSDRTGELWSEFIWSNIADIDSDEFENCLKTKSYEIAVMKRGKNKKTDYSKAEQIAFETVIYLSDIYNIGIDTKPKETKEFLMYLYRMFYLCGPNIYSGRIGVRMMKYEEECGQKSIMELIAGKEEINTNPFSALKNLNLGTVMTQGYEIFKDKIPEELKEKVDGAIKNQEGDQPMSISDLIQKATDTPQIKNLISGATEFMGNLFNNNKTEESNKEIHTE